MINYPSFIGKLVKMNDEYPIWDSEDDHKQIGSTKVGDMAVVVFADDKQDYYEMRIVSGEFIGKDTLALNSKDLLNSTFIFNRNDDNGNTYIYIRDKRIKYEYL